MNYQAYNKLFFMTWTYTRQEEGWKITVNKKLIICFEETDMDMEL